MSEKVGHSVLPIPKPVGSEWQGEQRTSIDAPLASKGTPNTHEVFILRFIAYVFFSLIYMIGLKMFFQLKSLL